MKNDKLLLNKEFQVFFNQIIGVQLHKDKHMNQFHIHNLYNLIYYYGPNQLYVTFIGIQNEWNFMCEYFWYYMYFQFQHKVCTPYQRNTQTKYVTMVTQYVHH